jgi:hypothetical protein
MRTRSFAAAGVALAALVAAAATAGASADGIAAQSCVPKDNVEAIIDDSGSMLFTDDSRLRVRAMELFIDNQANDKRTLGAIEFGTDAQRLFSPTTISGNRATMKSAIDTAIQGDNGLTDYNDAFSVAGTENPSATARIFLTDGGHSTEPPVPYANGHRGGPPVYVIGLNVLGEGDARLQQIASETGGLYRRVNEASQLQSAMFDVNAAIGCLATPIRLVNTFNNQGQTVARSVRLPAGVRSVNTALSWDDPEDAFDITAIRVIRKGKVVARGSKVRRLRVTMRRGATFVTVKISRLVRGKLAFKLKATRLSSGGSARLTTQVVRSRTR